MKTAGLGGGVVAVLLGATSLAAQAGDRAKPPALPPPPAPKLPPGPPPPPPHAAHLADAEVVRQRELRRAQIVQLGDNPVAMAGIAFPAIVFGRAHPYGRPLNGTEASTTVLSRDRVTEFYRASYRPNAARILIVGDVTLAAARRLLTARLGAWERGSVPALPGAAAPAPASRAVYLVDKPGAAQSVIRIGHVGVARTTPDYFALQGLDTIPGGAINARHNPHQCATAA